MKTSARIALMALALMWATVIGLAQSPQSYDFRISEKGAYARISDEGVKLTVPIERSSRMPVTGALEAKLYDLKGRRIARAYRQTTLVSNPSDLEVFLRADIESGEPERYIVEYSFRAKGVGLSERSSLYTLVPLIETRTLGPRNVMAGSEASLRVIVRDANHDAYIKNASVKISLDGKQVFFGKSNSSGTVSPRFNVPEKPGAVKLAIDIDSPLGPDSYETELTVVEAEKILLVTDKPLYQPGQDIHLRALALRKPGLEPLANRNLTFEVDDAKGNKVFKRAVKTDEYGIASAVFTLASEVNMGEYKARAIIEDKAKVEKTVTVDRYTLPRFKISFKADKPYYQPGQTVKGKLNADYFFGKPVAGGEITITASKFDVGFHAFATMDGATDAEGYYSFDVALPDYFVGEPLEQGKARVMLQITVKDGAGHEETKTEWLTVAKNPILVEVIPESESMVKSVPNKLFVVTSTPGGEPAAGVKIHDPFSGKWLDADDTGIAIIDFTPETDRIDASIEVKDSQGNRVSKKLDLSANGNASAILLRTDHGIYRAGEDMRLTILSRRDGAAFVDLIKDGQTMQTAWTDIRNGVGELALPIPLDAQGSAVTHAYRLSPEGNWMRDTRRVIIEPATELTIEVRPDKKTYLPAEEAAIDFYVRNKKGGPVAAALGVQIVDESVFALQEMRPGLEKIYFLLEEELAKPRYEIHGFSIPGVVIMDGKGDDEPPSPPAAAERRDRISRVLLAAAHTDQNYGINVNTADNRRSNFNSAMREYLQYRADEIVAAGNKYRARRRNEKMDYSTKIEKFVSMGLLNRRDILDPWGNELKVTGYHPYPRIVSAGMDGKFGTGDDIVYEKYEYLEEDMMRDGGAVFRRPRKLGMAPPMPAMAAEAPREANGRPKAELKKRNGGGRDGGGEEPRIRSYFPETLFVEPSLITDGRGHARTTVNMADSITTWRLTAMANSQNGALGSATHAITVFQEFFVDIILPVALTRNDRVTIPVAVYNYLPESQNVRLEIQKEDWFDLRGGSTRRVKLAKNEVKGVGIDITVKDVGTHTITVKAYGRSRSDAVRRSVEVIPDGQEMTAIFNGRLEGNIEHAIAYPGGAIPGANKLFVKVYPGILSQVIEGLDNIFRMPGGCFEQTSSTTYPNILVLDYMQKAKIITPELKMKAEGFINSGYQRLLTFEVNGGGFEWFGNDPAHVALTAYGLMEFNDMSKVHNVDPDVIRRTQKWLVSIQQENGSWKPNQHYLDQVASRFSSDALRNTAYVAWALAETGYKGAGLSKAIGYIKDNRKDAKDLYTKALMVMALASADHKDPVARELVNEIIEKGVVKKDSISFPAGADTAVHSSGQSADIETTALVGMALLKMGIQRDVTSKIINYLIENKDSYGTWHSTQATVFSLKTLIGSLDMATEGGNAVVTVKVDGKERGVISLEGEKAEILQQLDLSHYATTGKHDISLSIKGEGSAFYSIVGRHYIPWSKLAPIGKSPLEISVEYDRSDLEVNDIATATATATNMTRAVAHMVIMDLGVPPGFEALTEDLDKYVENKTIQKYSMTGRQIIVYLEKIDPKSKISLKYRLKATMPMRAQTFASRVYEYYNPANEAFAKPAELSVAGE